MFPILPNCVVSFYTLVNFSVSFTFLPENARKHCMIIGLLVISGFFFSLFVVQSLLIDEGLQDFVLGNVFFILWHVMSSGKSGW